MNNDVAVVSLFELPDLVDDVTGKDGGVVPFGVGQGLRDDVLGHGVELVRELALVVRPDGSEAVVGDPAEQKGVRVHRLVELELVAFRAAAEGVGPADALEALGSARRLDDAVDGHVLSDDDSSHLHSPFAVVLIVKFGSASSEVYTSTTTFLMMCSLCCELSPGASYRSKRALSCTITQFIPAYSCGRFAQAFVPQSASALGSDAADRNSQPGKRCQGSTRPAVRESSRVGPVRFAEQSCVSTRWLARNDTVQRVPTILAAGLVTQPPRPDHEPANLHAPAALQTYLHFRRWEIPTQSLEAKRIDWSLQAGLHLFDPEGALVADGAERCPA